MINAINKTTSDSEINVDVNESYFGLGALSFMEECAKDELALFEAGIMNDMKEVQLTESSELNALNEGFVETAKTKITEIMKKFIAWLDAVTKSAIAKLTSLIMRDTAKFATHAKAELDKRDTSNFKYNGKCIDVTKFSKTENNISSENILESIFGSITKDSSVEDMKKCIETAKKAEDKSVSDMVDAITIEVKDGNMELVKKHIEILEDLGKEMKMLKEKMNNYKAKAKEIAKAAKNISDPNEAAAKTELANAYKKAAQNSIMKLINFVKNVAKIARAVVVKALASTSKVKDEKKTEEKVNTEGFFVEYDEELADAMIEAADFEYDDAVEETCACKKESDDCCDDDCDNDDDSDEE